MKTGLLYIIPLFVALHPVAQVLTNKSGVTINVSGTAVLSGGSVSNAGTISNGGAMVLTSGLDNSGNINGNGNYNIGGNWLNNGTFKAGNGAVNFNGAILQTIGGISSTRFSNLILSGTGDVSLTTNGSFTGVLTINNSGSFTGSATDTLISTPASTARVAQVTGTGTITSNFVVQRYDNRTIAQYQALSSPVKNTTLGDWNISNRNPNFYMSGVGGPDGNAGSYVSVKLYNETSNNYDNITAYANPGINYTLKQGQGLYLWMGNNLYGMSPFTYITHGVPTVGNVNLNVTYTAGKGYGFQILGNPYPSPISWASFVASNPSLQTTYYVFEQDGSWHTFTSGNIAMEQGFGVVTASAATVTFKESHKSSVDGALLKMGDPTKEDNAVTFTLSDDANAFSCPTVVSFGKNYSSAYNPSEDAVFIESHVEEVPQVFTYSSDNLSVALNRLPDDSAVVDIPLTTGETINANYTLTALNLDKLSSYNCVLLIDKSNGRVVNNFLETPAYTFSAENAPQKKDFTLRFSRIEAGQSCAVVKDAANEDIQVYAVQHSVVINTNFEHPENIIISVYSELGQSICPNLSYNVQKESLSIPLPAVNGLYIVRIQTANGVTTKKIAVRE